MFRYGIDEGCSWHSSLGNAHSAIHNAVEQTAMPFLSPRMTKAGRAGVVRLLHVVWFGGSETPAHAWTVRSRGKDVVVVGVRVRGTHQTRVCGAVSRHQHQATTDDLLALLNAVIAGAVFSESMLASAYAAMQCVQPKRPGMRVEILQPAARLNGSTLSVDVDRRVMLVEYDGIPDISV